MHIPRISDKDLGHFSIAIQGVQGFRSDTVTRPGGRAQCPMTNFESKLYCQHTWQAKNW